MPSTDSLKYINLNVSSFEEQTINDAYCCHGNNNLQQVYWTHIFAGCDLVYVLSICEDDVLPVWMLTYNGECKWIPNHFDKWSFWYSVLLQLAVYLAWWQSRQAPVSQGWSWWPTWCGYWCPDTTSSPEDTTQTLLLILVFNLLVWREHFTYRIPKAHITDLQERHLDRDLPEQSPATISSPFCS